MEGFFLCNLFQNTSPTYYYSVPADIYEPDLASAGEVLRCVCNNVGKQLSGRDINAIVKFSKCQPAYFSSCRILQNVTCAPLRVVAPRDPQQRSTAGCSSATESGETSADPQKDLLRLKITAKQKQNLRLEISERFESEIIIYLSSKKIISLANCLGESRGFWVKK